MVTPRGSLRSAGAQLKLWRQQKGWSEAELARRAGLSAQHLRRLEEGENKPRQRTVQKLAVALGKSFDEVWVLWNPPKPARASKPAKRDTGLETLVLEPGVSVNIKLAPDGGVVVTLTPA